jgi:predicted nucleic acid-binding protein
VALTVLDASIVIAVLDIEDAHHAAARAGLASRLDALDTFVLPVSAYAETLVGAFRGGDAAVATVEAFLDALPARIEPATPAIGRHAAGLRAQHGRRMPLPDAFVVATALELRAERVLTTDRRWPAIGVRVDVL